MTVKMKVNGVKELRQKLARMQSEVKKPGNFLQIAGVAGFRNIMDHFEKETGPKGRWTKLKYKRKLRAGQKKGIRDKKLQDTGRLRESVRWRAIKNSVIFFNNVEYAVTHQKGDKRRKIPARPFIWLSKNLISDLAKRYAKFVRKDMK